MRITRPEPGARVPLDSIDLTAPELFSDGDPHLVWQTLRAEAPVFRQYLPDGRGFWSVTRYDDCCRVLSDHRRFTSERGAILKMLGTDDPAGGVQMAVSDPPRHTQMRKPLAEMLTRSALIAHEPGLRRAIQALLAPMTEARPWDLGWAMSAVPMIVMRHLMGLPPEDEDDLIRWGYMTVAPDDPAFQIGGDAEATLREAQTNLFVYFSDVVRARRRRPVPEDGPQDGSRDLIGRLMTMQVDGRPLSDSRIVSNCYSLLLGANVNTGHVISAALLAAIEDPGVYPRWSGDPALWAPGLREALRWSSPVVHFLRHAVAETEIRGQRIAAGDGVVAWLPSANRDAEVFADPFVFRPDRAPNREIAFGYGCHRCIGATPAGLALSIALNEIFERVEAFELAGPVRHLRSNFTAGITSLSVVAHPRRQAPPKRSAKTDISAAGALRKA